MKPPLTPSIQRLGALVQLGEPCACTGDLAGALLRRKRETLDSADDCGPLDEDRVRREGELLASTYCELFGRRARQS